MPTVKIALAQISSGNDLETNLATMRRLMEDAARKNARIVAFPEMAYLMGESPRWMPHLTRYDELLARFQQWSRELGMALLPGSLREPVPGATDRHYNTLPLIDASGHVIAVYRKLFLFKATLPDRIYNESRYCEPGNAIVTANVEGIDVGLAICFDLRFPELFRALKRRGAQLIFLPSAFTATTGQAHWATLVQARAIENQLFVAAPAQTGRVGDGGETFGHSLVVSPWGERLAECERDQALITATVDSDAIQQSRAKVDAWACRREDMFPIG